MQFKAKTVGRINIPKDRCIVLDHAQVKGEDYSGRDFFQFGAIGSILTRCRFDKARIEHAQFGAGREPSVFVECSFDGVRMDIGPGGYTRFVRCSFRDIDLRDWFCFTVELVDCTFSGRMRKAIFNGAVPEEDRALLGRDRNEFHGNDFSAMDLIDVAFRTGIDLSQQRLPSGPEYLYLPEPEAVLQRARLAVLGWQNLELRRPAMAMVNGFEEDVKNGQRQLLLRAKDYSGYSSLPQEAVARVFALLREGSGASGL